MNTLNAILNAPRTEFESPADLLAAIEAEEERKKTVVIVGGTREAAYAELKQRVPDDGIVRRDWHDEVETDDCRTVAIGGGPDDVCHLRDAGFRNVEIVTVEDASISEAMWRRIRHVRSTQEG